MRAVLWFGMSPSIGLAELWRCQGPMKGGFEPYPKMFVKSALTPEVAVCKT